MRQPQTARALVRHWAGRCTQHRPDRRGGWVQVVITPEAQRHFVELPSYIITLIHTTSACWHQTTTATRPHKSPALTYIPLYRPLPNLPSTCLETPVSVTLPSTRQATSATPPMQRSQRTRLSASRRARKTLTRRTIPVSVSHRLFVRHAG